MNFHQRTYELVKRIPKGKVATYGQVATVLGQPRAARMVGVALSKSINHDVPWQRVVNRNGMISIENLAVSKDDQAELLRQEGVEVIVKDNNFYINLNQHLVSDELLLVEAATI